MPEGPMARVAVEDPNALTRAARTALLLLALALTGSAVVLTAQFRSSVDVIAVDVQVLDNDSYPIGPLDAKAFEVSINKQRRQVISAQFIRHSSNENVLPSPAGIAALRQEAGETYPGGGRT